MKAWGMFSSYVLLVFPLILSAGSNERIHVGDRGFWVQVPEIQAFGDFAILPA